MRTTLDLDDATMTELMRLTGETTKTRAVEHALDWYLRQLKLEKAVKVFGTLHFDLGAEGLERIELAARRRKERGWKLSKKTARS